MLNDTALYNAVGGVEYTEIAFFLADINTHHRDVLWENFNFQNVTFLSYTEAERFFTKIAMLAKNRSRQTNAVPDRLKERVPYETTA